MATYSEIRQARERAGRSSRQPGYRPPRPTRSQLAGAVTNLRPNLRPNLSRNVFGELGGAVRPRLPDVSEIGGGVETFGNVVGGPRAMLVSAIKEGIDLVQDVAGAARGRGWGGESSWDDYWRQSTSNYGFGDLVHDEKATIGVGLMLSSPFTGPVGPTLGASLLAERYLDFDPMGAWNNRIIGFIGDVALDPLTYMGGANVMLRGMGYKGAGIMLGNMKTLSKSDLGTLLNRGGFSGIKPVAARKAIDDAVKLAQDGRSIGTIQRSLQKTPAGRAVARAAGLEPGLRLRVPGTGGVGRAFGNTRTGERLGAILDSVPGTQTMKSALLNQRIRNAPEALTFGLDSAQLTKAASSLSRGRVAARKALKGRGELPPAYRPIRGRRAVSQEADRAARRTMRGLDPRLAKVAGQVARSHVEFAVPGIAKAGAGGAKIADALSKIPGGGILGKPITGAAAATAKTAEMLSKIPGRGGAVQPLLGGRMFGRSDFLLTAWRNMPVGGNALGPVGKAARLWNSIDDTDTTKLSTVLSPEGWRETYANNPGLAQDVQKGLTKFYRSTLSPNDEIFRDLLRSGDPNQIVRAWQSEQSLRYARGQVSFFREVNRQLVSRLATETRQLAKTGVTERQIGRWMRAALKGDALRLNAEGEVVGINRLSPWFKVLPKQIKDLTDQQLVGIAKTTREGVGDGSKVLRNGFGEPVASGERVWTEENNLISEEGMGFFPRRLTDWARGLFDIKVYTNDGTNLGRGAFEGGYVTSQSMRQRSWRPGGSVRLTDKGAAAANPKFVYRDSSGQSWLGRPSSKDPAVTVKFKIKNPNAAYMSVQDQIDDVAEQAFGQPIFEGPLAALKSYGGGMGQQLGGESMMSHLKYTVGMDDMFRMSDDVVSNMRKVAGDVVEEAGDNAQMTLFDLPGAPTRPVWDAYTQTKRASLDKKLEKVVNRTRSLFVSSKAQLEEVEQANVALRQARADAEAETGAASPLDAEETLAFRGLEKSNTAMVKNFGEMEGITEEMAYIGARLNQFYTENADAMARGTFEVPEDVRTLILRAHDLAARAYAIVDNVGKMAPAHQEWLDALGALGRISPEDLNSLDDLFTGMSAGVRRSMAYLSGEEGYVGQFPLAVQQGKELMVNDKTVGDLVDLARVLDAGRADELAAAARRAGSVAQAQPEVPLPQRKWAVAEARRQGKPDSAAKDLIAGWRRARSITGDITEVDISEIHALIEPGVRPGYRTTEVTFQGGGSANKAASIPRQMEQLVNSGLHKNDPEEFVRQFLRIHPFEDGNGRTAVVLLNHLAPAPKGYRPLPDFFGEGFVTPPKYKDWGEGYKEARRIFKEFDHEEFISYGITGEVPNLQAVLDSLDEDISGLSEYTRMWESVQALRGGDVEDRLLDRVVPGRPMGEPLPENIDVTPPAVLEAVVQMRDDARLLFDEAAALRAEIAEIDQRTAGLGRGVLRNERVRRTILKDAALAAELEAQSLSRESAELLDVTRAEREVLKLDDFLSKSDATLQQALDPSKPIGDRVEMMNALVDAVADGLPNFGPWRLASGNAVLDANMVAAAEAYSNLLRLKDPAEMRWFLRNFDKVQNWFKAGVIATPGFVYRNLFGAFFNAYLDGVDLNQITMAFGAQRRIQKEAKAKDISFLQAARNMSVVNGKPDPYMEDVVRLLESGLRGGGHAAYEATPFTAPVQQGDIPWWTRAKETMERGVTVGSGRRARNLGTVLPVGPGSSNFMFNRLIRRVNTTVEDTVRLGVGMDTLRWGGSLEDALDRIARTQFDYSELSGAESGVMRRLVPFYVWTRKNVPYQFAKLASNPAAYNRAMAVKKNMEIGTEDKGMVPDWFLEPFGIRTPWTMAGARVYGVPDMPFLDLYRYDPTRMKEGDPFYGVKETWQNLVWQMTPVLKTGIEIMAQKQLSNGYAFSGKFQEMPAVLENTVGLIPALDRLGITRTRDGKRQIRDWHMYFVLNSIPQLGLLRRVAPSEERYQQRLFETIFSTVFGLGVQRQTRDVKNRWRDRLERELRERERNEGGGGNRSGGGFG